jgi:hypothetical protein
VLTSDFDLGHEPATLRTTLGPPELLGRFYALATPEALSQALRDIRHSLHVRGIDFEGREVPISLLPTWVFQRDLARVARAGALIRQALLAVLDRFLDEHRRGALDGPVHALFAPYRKWWDLIARERRTQPAIGLMRFDTVREVHGAWRVLETNTACPGGTISCAKVRDAWLHSSLGRCLTEGLPLHAYPIDDTAGFVKFLVHKAQVVAQHEAPNIALCWYKGLYTNELASLRAEHRLLVERGEVPGGEIILCDIRDIRCDGGQAFAFGKPVSLIHNKIDQLMVDPADPELEGWRRAAEGPRVEFLNSLGALYLTEAKRVLALLSGPSWWPILQLDRATTRAIEELVPVSRVLPEDGQGPKAEQLLRLLEHNRHHLVLKADSLTRGQGVYIGSKLSAADWRAALRETARNHGIVQVCVNTPRRETYGLGGDEVLEPVTDFYGIDLFYFDDAFAGAVSRSHSDMVFNVGNGGKESPTLVIG